MVSFWASERLSRARAVPFILSVPVVLMSPATVNLYVGVVVPMPMLPAVLITNEFDDAVSLITNGFVPDT